MPLARSCSTSAPTSDSAGCGSNSRAGPSAPRSTPSSRRMSVSAARPVSPMVPSARVAAAGSASAAYRPPSAWAIITVREWATMSCISRAMRARSAAVAICVCWSRSTSRRRARSSRASIRSRRDRRTSPNAHTASATTPVNIAVIMTPAGVVPAAQGEPEHHRARQRSDDRDPVRPARTVHRHRVQGDQDHGVGREDDRHAGRAPGAARPRRSPPPTRSVARGARRSGPRARRRRAARGGG